jgi:hypothetical protein
MVRAILLGIVLVGLVGPTPSTAQQSSEKDFTGVYSCEGTNPDGKSYVGLVEILKVQGTYLVRWTMPNDTQVMGVGIFSENVLAVSYFGGSPAVVVYSTNTDGRLDGKWTMGGAEGFIFKETLTKMSNRKPSAAPAPAPRRELPKDSDEPRIKV